MKKIVPVMLACSMLFTSAAIVPVSYAEGSIVAGMQEDGSYLIGDFTDSATATAWADTSTTTTDKYDTVFKALSLGWVQTDSSGAYLDTYKADVFEDLDFGAYDNFNMSFHLNKNADLGYTSLNNYLTIVLSTAQTLGDYGSYKKDECLIYELPLSSYALNETVEVSIPLTEFVTQFDGMSGGVQGEADGITNLSDIKSIGLFGGYAGFFGAKDTAAQPEGWTWLFKNSGQNENMSCGFLLYDMSLSKFADYDVQARLDAYMSKYEIVEENITLPTALDGFDGSIEWLSDNTKVIGNDGTITQPAEDTTILLTATITNADGTVETAEYSVTVKAKVTIKAGLQEDGTYLIGDFTDAMTATAWADSSLKPEDKYDTAYKGLSLNWTLTGSSGSYLKDNSEIFADLNFTDYDNLEIEFELGKNESLGVTSINNYMTIILSTADDLGDYGDYKKNECLVYEMPLNTVTLNDKVKVSIPLISFTTQFDGMVNGVQGTADGITSLADIKSIGFFGGHAGFFGATGGAAQPEGWTWLFKNSGQNEDMSCGVIVYNMSLSGDDEVNVKALLDTYMAKYAEVEENITLPTTLEGFDGTIEWSSDNTNVIKNDGTVIRPAEDTIVPLIAAIIYPDGSVKVEPYNVKVKAKITIKAGLQDDGTYLIGDFTDAITAAAWADTSVAETDKYDTVYKALSLGWVQSDSSGSYLDAYKTENFADLSFADFNTFNMSFLLNKNAELGYTSLGNYLTIVLSTAETLGDYGSYKNNECLVYEIPLSEYALNEEVAVSIPLKDFITQFDGMANGVQGTADGITSLADIKSIGLFGGNASVFGATGGAAQPEGWTWLFKNSGQNENMSCGFLLYDMSLSNKEYDNEDDNEDDKDDEEEIVGFNLHKADGTVLEVLDNAAQVYGKVKSEDIASDESVKTIIAVYKDNRLVECKINSVTAVNGEITTQEIAVDPELHDKVTAFIWDASDAPIMNTATVKK